MATAKPRPPRGSGPAPLPRGHLPKGVLGTRPHAISRISVYLSTQLLWNIRHMDSKPQPTRESLQAKINRRAWAVANEFSDPPHSFRATYRRDLVSLLHGALTELRALPPAAPDPNPPVPATPDFRNAALHACNEWADALTNAMQWVRNIREVGTTTGHVLGEIEKDLERCRGVTRAAFSSAPAVATDPEPAPLPPLGYVYEQYQMRMLEERDQLAERTAALDRFIWEDAKFVSLPEGERRRLVRQLSPMQSYLSVLNERITAFGGDTVWMRHRAAEAADTNG